MVGHAAERVSDVYRWRKVRCSPVSISEYCPKRSRRHPHFVFSALRQKSKAIQDRIHFVGPLPEDTGNVGGVGLYHQKLVASVAALAPDDCELSVYAQSSVRDIPERAFRDVRIVKAWRSGPLAILDLWKLVLAKPGVFVIQYEVKLFGSILVSLLLPLLITLLRFRGSRVFVLMHHVIGPNLTSDTLKDWKTPSFLDSAGLVVLRANQRLIATVATAAIVHEPSQAAMLASQRAVVVPHGVSVSPSRQQPTHFPESALRVALFGFIAPYKGSLEAAEAASLLLAEGARIELNIVGGEHPRMRSSPDYRNYVAKLRALAESHPELNLKGFVPGSQLDTVLLENDLVILPYKSAVGVSGALSYAIGLGLPVAISDTLGTLMDLPMDVPRFDPSIDGIAAFLRQVIGARQLPNCDSIRALAASRSWTAVGERLWDLMRRSDF